MNSRVLTILSTILGLVAILILGYFIFMPKQKNGEVTQQNNGGSFGMLTEPVVMEAPTSSEWKSYKVGNQEFKSNAVPIFTIISSSTTPSVRGF